SAALSCTFDTRLWADRSSRPLTESPTGAAWNAASSEPMKSSRASPPGASNVCTTIFPYGRTSEEGQSTRNCGGVLNDLSKVPSEFKRTKLAQPSQGGTCSVLRTKSLSAPCAEVHHTPSPGANVGWKV